MNERSPGGVWERDGQYGKYLYVKIEIDGETYTFYGNLNKKKVAGDKFPDYHLVPAKPKEQKPDPLTTLTDKEKSEMPF